MSQDPVHPLHGTWHVYRYNHSRHVLKSRVTKLENSKGNHGELMMSSFEMSGWEYPIAAEMLLDPTTGAWFGEKGSYDFCWAPFQKDKTDVLVGYALDRHDSDYCDSFVAVTKKRKFALVVNEGEEKDYRFDKSQLAPFQRGKGAEPCAVFIKCKQERGEIKGEITLKKKNMQGQEEQIIYPGVIFRKHEGGLIGAGVFAAGKENESRIELWILPLDRPDRTDQMLVTGYFSELMSSPGDVSPGPECTFTVHGSQK